VVAAGPLYYRMEIKENQAVLSFTDIGTGLMSKDGNQLRNFEIAGQDGVFYDADAYIENDQVIVSCKNVPIPAQVRYAWCDSPENINFYNREGLPASPFRSQQIIIE
jgi:sialate O-acetylesterase